jgi:type II secretory pathway predicted ATPase ExeA
VKHTPTAAPFPYADFQQALHTLTSALARTAAYALVTGESGSGKTTLLRCLAAQLDRRRFHILYLSQGQPSPSSFVRLLAENFHLPARRTRAETSRLLVPTLRHQPTHLVLSLDEAQAWADETLQEIRLLAEADPDGPPLFSVILCGLPSLRERLLAPHLFPFWRRLRSRVCLTGLRREELPALLAHHLGQDGLARFEPLALEVLFEQARGLPALIRDRAEDCLKAYPKGTLSAPQVAEVLDRMEAA